MQNYKNSNSSAYLDIETTGLDPACADISVIGIYIEDENNERIIQLVGEEIQDSKLLKIFKGIENLFTYNGTQFDLPFIRAKLGIELERYCTHIDLMYICWENSLYGGLKKVEKKLGIKRETEGIDGKGAVLLWHKYCNYGDKEALNTLLKYNAEDLTNLKLLRQRLQMLADHIEIENVEEL